MVCAEVRHWKNTTFVKSLVVWGHFRSSQFVELVDNVNVKHVDMLQTVRPNRFLVNNGILIPIAHQDMHQAVRFCLELAKTQFLHRD